MSVQGISSSSMALAVWQLRMQSSSAKGATQTGGASCGGSDGNDNATISQQGFAMLMTMQQGGSSGQPQPIDDMATKIGAKIQERNPDLFKKIDANGDGQLSVDELKAGKDQIKAARAAAIGSKIQDANPALFKALDTNGDGTLGTDELQAVRSLLQGNEGSASTSTASADAPAGTGSSGVHHHHHHHGGGGDGSGGGQAQDLASLLAPQGLSSGTDSSSDLQTSGSGSGQASSSNSFQINSISDVLQNLFVTAGKPGI